jgi:hypothetical protein
MPDQMHTHSNALLPNFNETIYLATSEIKTITFRTFANFIITYGPRKVPVLIPEPRGASVIP